MNKMEIFLNKRGIWIVFYLSIIAAVSATCYFYFHNEILNYNDSLTRLIVARQVFDNQTPGIVQLGTVWLPLYPFLMIPFVMNDFLWHTGLAGSIVSGISLVVTSLYAFKTVQLLTKKAWLGILGFLIIAFNINILYMSTTAMAEMLLLATLFGGIYHFLKWLEKEELGHLLIAALWIALATLVRYEGWLLAVACTTIILFNFTFIKKNMEKMQSYTIVFSILGFFGIFLWLLWNTLFWNNPFYFISSAQYSLSNGAGIAAPTRHNLLMSIETIYNIIWFNLGTILLALLPISLSIALLIKGNRRLIIYSVVLTSVPLIVNLVTLYFGITIIIVNGLKNSLDLRYGITSIIMVSIVLPVAISKLNKKLKPIICIVVILACLFIPQSSLATSLYGGESSINPDSKAFVDYFAKIYKGGKILSTNTYIFSSLKLYLGIPLHNYTIEGNWHIWSSTLLDPHKENIEYIFMANSKGEEHDDPVYQAYLKHQKLYNTYYTLTYQSSMYSIYKARKDINLDTK